MKTHYFLRHFLSAFILFFSITGNLFAANWSGTFTPALTSGCPNGITSSVNYNNNGGCTSNMNVTVTLQRSSSPGGPFTFVTSQTKTIGNGTVTFDRSYITQTGYYRCFISGSPNTGTCGVTTITSAATNAVFITIHPYSSVSFNINGTEQYYTGVGSSWFNVVGCAPIILNATTSGTVLQHRLVISESPAAGGFLGEVYNSGWVSGAVPATRTLPALASSKHYMVQVQVDNGNCVSGKIAFIYVTPNGPTASVGFKVNGAALSTNCSAPSQFYKCSAYPITLSNQSANVDKYVVLLERSTSGMCGPYSQVYGEELSTFPTDMKNLPGANGTYLQTNNGYYRFTIYGKNVCGVIQSLVSGNFRVDSEPTPSVAFKVNGAALPTDCNATIPSFFNCSAFPLVLNNESSNISTYDITLQYSTVGSCGLYTQIYETPVPLTSLPTDLKNLPGFNGNFIQDNPGNYLILVIGRGACGVTTFNWGYMNIMGAPTPNTQFVTKSQTRPSGTPFSYRGCSVPYNTEISYVKDATDNCSARVFGMTTTDVSDPNPVGRLSTVFDLNSVNGGTGSSEYTVSILSEIWQSGNWVIMNHNNEPELITSPSNLSLTSLLYYDDIDPLPEYNLYFDYGATNGDIFRITVIVENECGSSSQSQIIKYSPTVLKLAEAGGAETTEGEREIQVVQEPVVYPNPITSNVRFEVPAAAKDRISISLFDLKGAHILDVVKDVEAGAGTTVYSSNLENLTSGMYLYQITVNTTVFNGKLSKE